MVNKILTAAGVAHRRGRYTGKAKTYAVWMDDLTTQGADKRPQLLVQHDITVELYEGTPDDAIESAIEAAIATEGLQYTKQDRYWLATEQMYQVIYEFTYFTKGGPTNG